MFDFGDPSWLASPEGALIVLTMAELGDGKRCPECGGQLRKLEDGTYLCGECGARFRAE